jgi:hypothetical protein
MLWRQELTLLPPQSWEDRNDAYYLERYQEDRKLGSVLALCFSTRRETFHHWRVFSHGASGVCVEFNREELLDALDGRSCFKHGLVEYRRIDEVEARPPDVTRWPFLKRLPYKDESEYRIICESAKEELSVSLPFDIASIKRVTLSPWMPRAVAESVADLIETIPDCSGIHTMRSTLVENARWKKVIKK